MSFINLRRRRMLAAVAGERILYIYNKGIANNYLFAEAGSYGASSKGRYSRVDFEEDHIFVRAYDSSASAGYGISVCEQNGLKRKLLSRFSAIKFECKTEQSESYSANEREVAVYTENSDISTAKAICPVTIVSSTEASDYAVYSISVNDVLEQETEADTFYVGAGVRTKSSYAPGEQAIYIRKIWLER